MPRRRRWDPARSRPLSLEFLRDLGALRDVAAPAEPFDRNGAWTNSYRLWLVQRNLGGGCLTVRREPTAGGAVRLHADLAVAEWSGYVRRTTAVLECAGDALCTPKSWRLDSQCFDIDDKPIAATKLSERGTIADGILEIRFGQRSRKEKVPQPVTSNWSLFDAVQRLPGAKTAPLKFALLEEMDLLKADQRLEFREAKKLKLGDATLQLRGYNQIGRGVLPWQYWVDAQGRLLFAFSGVRAFIRDAKATEWMQAKLDRARTRAKRMRKAK